MAATNRKRQAEKDAKRYAKAKMDYGDGAGIKRRHMAAELEKKMQDPYYSDAFQAALNHINYEDVIRDVKAKNNARDTWKTCKKVFKGVAKTGTVAAAGYAFYTNNKNSIDGFVEKMKNKVKYRKQTRKANLDDKKKAEFYLKSVGIDHTY